MSRALRCSLPAKVQLLTPQNAVACRQAEAVSHELGERNRGRHFRETGRRWGLHRHQRRDIASDRRARTPSSDHAGGSIRPAIRLGVVLKLADDYPRKGPENT